MIRREGDTERKAFSYHCVLSVKVKVVCICTRLSYPHVTIVDNYPKPCKTPYENTSRNSEKLNLYNCLNYSILQTLLPIQLDLSEKH